MKGRFINRANFNAQAEKHVTTEKRVTGVWNSGTGKRKSVAAARFEAKVHIPYRAISGALPSGRSFVGIATTVTLTAGAVALALIVLLMSRDGPGKVADATVRETAAAAARITTLTIHERDNRPRASRTTTERRFRAGSKKFSVVGLTHADRHSYRRLLLLDVETNRMRSVRVGEELVPGFRVSDLTPLSVTITSRDEATTIQL